MSRKPIRSANITAHTCRRFSKHPKGPEQAGLPPAETPLTSRDGKQPPRLTGPGGVLPPQSPDGGANGRSGPTGFLLMLVTYLIANDVLAGENVALTLSAAGSSANLEVPAYLALVLLVAIIRVHRR